jgi:hypothetical protein
MLCGTRRNVAQKHTFLVKLKANQADLPGTGF